MDVRTKTFEFYPGEYRVLNIQVMIYNRTLNASEPMVITEEDSIQIELPANPDNILIDKTPSDEPYEEEAPASLITIVNGDLGKISVTLTEAQTALMTSGSMIIRINAETDMTKIAVAIQGIKRTAIPGC